MKKLLILLLVFAVAISCKDDAKDPRPDLNDSVGAITLISDVTTSGWDLGLLATETVSWAIDVDGFDLTEVESVSVQVIFTDVGRLPNPDPDGAPLDSVYAPIELSVLTSFPSTFSVSAAEMAALIPDITSTDEFFIGDNFNFIFPISTTDGRVLTTALNSDLCQQPAQPSFGGCNVSLNVICPFVTADAVGTWEVVEDEFVSFVGGATTFEVVAGPGADQITVVNIFNHDNPATGNKDYDVIFDIDPATGNTTVAQQDAWHCDNFGCAFGQGTIQGSGATFSCLGVMNLNLEFRVAAGTFGVNVLNMRKL